MNQSEGQVSVKEYLIAGYEGKLQESELLESRNNIYEFCSILLDIAKEQKQTNAGYDSANAGTTSI